MGIRRRASLRRRRLRGLPHAGAADATAAALPPTPICCCTTWGPASTTAWARPASSSAEWRTAPLIAMHAGAGRRFLHDGRAATLDAAIRAHGGEADAAVTLSCARRERARGARRFCGGVVMAVCRDWITSSQGGGYAPAARLRRRRAACRAGGGAQGGAPAPAATEADYAAAVDKAVARLHRSRL